MPASCDRHGRVTALGETWPNIRAAWPRENRRALHDRMG